MKKSFWKVVNEVLYYSDVVIEVLDARFPEQTRNVELEKKVLGNDKNLIIVLNKADLLSKELVEKEKYKIKGIPVVYLSSKNRRGLARLREQLMILTKKSEHELLRVGVVGYPNTGKSSVINALKGRGSASTAPSSGHTKGKQHIRIHKKILLVDSPGVLPFEEKDEIKHALIASLNPQKIKDPEAVALHIIDLFLENDPQKLKNYYQIEFLKKDDSFDILEKIAEEKKKVKKGGEADTELMSRIIIQDWQKGKLRI